MKREGERLGRRCKERKDVRGIEYKMETHWGVE